MSHRIALGIPHAIWLPERRDSMAVLRSQLGYEEGTTASFRIDDTGVHDMIDVCEFTEKETNREWARRMWAWAVSTPADFFVTLNDDSRVAPNFWPVLRAMIQVLPRESILGLAAQHPEGPELYAAGFDWYRTHAWAVGWGYGMWVSDLAEFCQWELAQPDSRWEGKGEDSVINEWVVETDRECWHPLPSIVDHDTNLRTTYNSNDQHEFREGSMSCVGMEADITLESPDHWRRNKSIPLRKVPVKRPGGKHAFGH